MTTNPTRRAALGALGAMTLGLAGWRAIHRRGLVLEDDDGALAHAVTLERAAMATVWKVVLPAGSPRRALAAAERALDEVERLEDLLSEFRPHTEIARVNANAGRAAVRVSEDTLAAVEHSVRYAALCDGAFDPTWAALRSLWDFRDPRARPPAPDAVRARLDRVGWRGVEVDRGAKTLRLARVGMALGLGGIAKGYTLDRMRDLLVNDRVRDFVLYSGGQVRVEGTRQGRPWRVGIQHPRDPARLLGAVSLTSGTVSTGGDYEHYFEHAGRRYHHVIDPKTGFPVEHTVAVTVVAPTGLEGDALDTALFVMPPDRAREMARRMDLAVMRTDPTITSEVTPAMRRRLDATPPTEGNPT